MKAIEYSSQGNEFDESLGGYEVFRRRAESDRGATDPTWRVGFDPVFRDGIEEKLAQTIMGVLTQGVYQTGNSHPKLLDIGSGSGLLTEAITGLCWAKGILHVVVDSPEMLSHLPEIPGRKKVPGRFPLNLPTLQREHSFFDYILAYSVLQYVIREADVDVFIDAATALLMPHGSVLVGDIPNRDMRDRQFLASGKEIPDLKAGDEIRDDFMIYQLQRIRGQGLHAYITPQDHSELMHLHRENLLVVRPGSYDYSEKDGAT